MIHTRITDNGDGTLKAEYQVLAGIGEDDQMIPAEENAITFQNSYKGQNRQITIEAVKKLEGGTLKEGSLHSRLRIKMEKQLRRLKIRKMEQSVLKIWHLIQKVLMNTRFQK